MIADPPEQKVFERPLHYRILRQVFHTLPAPYMGIPTVMTF